MMLKNEIETFCPANRADWRQWLHQNHQLKQSVWLVHYKKNAGMPTISWGEAVEEALCFGWIDSIRKTIDEDKFIQFFSKRKPSGTWSKVNKEKIKQLIDTGLMAQAGLDTITTAKQNGSWAILDDVEELMVPKDLEEAFATKLGSKEYYFSLSKSVRKAMLQWLVLAKQSSTRQKRIAEIAEFASQKLKPKQF